MRAFKRFAAALGACALAGCATSPGSVGRIMHDPFARPAPVTLDSGPVVGAATAWGKAWLGLPFAAQPVGELRWRAPQPVTAWSKPRQAFRLGPDCEQNLSPNALLGRPGGLFVRGSEKCLFLNVYAPSDAVAGQGWPVMVWIHGGGYVAGAAGNYDPSLMAQKRGVIVVTVNYRLGAFGFLAHPALTAEDPANGSGDYALLDQQAALRWVRDNIVRFGGDPHRVTIFGESAGGFSVCHQLAAPGGQGLFQGAIIESGACTGAAQNVTLAAAERGGAAMASDLGCGDAADAAACLRQVPAGRVARTVSHRVGALGENGWGAVVGGGVLPTPAAEAFATGRFAHVPVIVGTNHDEGRLFGLMQRLAGRLGSERSYAQVLDGMFGADAPRVLTAYPVATYGSPAKAYAAVVTDWAFACPAVRTRALLAPQTPVRGYEFADEDAPSTFPHLPGLPELRAYHSSEIVYVLQRPWIVADPGVFTPAQRRLSDAMQRYWADFAKTGDPNGAGLPTWAAGERPLTLAPDAIAPDERDFAAAHRCGFWTGVPR